MIRTVAVAVAAAALTIAMPSSARVTGPDRQQTDASRAVEDGAGRAIPVVEQVAEPAVAGREQFVTGQVVMTTPSEIVLHTDKGMQRFALAPEVQSEYVPAEGDTVTVGYEPGPGSVRVATIKRSAAAGDASGATAQAPAAAGGDRQPSQAGTEAQGSPAPTTAPAPATPAGGAESPQPPTRARAARLPKTGSERPLVLLVGLVALAAAGALRVAARA